MIKGNLLSKYYLFTPIFLLVAIFADENIRVIIPSGEDYLLYLYMAGCFVIGGIFLKKSVHINLFALIESSVNLVLLFKSTYLPVFLMATNPEQAVAPKFEMTDIIHFVMVGVVLLYAFYTNPIIKNKG